MQLILAANISIIYHYIVQVSDSGRVHLIKYVSGTAAMFAAGMLWVKNVVRLNNKITGLICFSCLCSEQLYSLVTGLVIEEHPRWFLYIMSANTAAVILCLLVMHFIASKKTGGEEQTRK